MNKFTLALGILLFAGLSFAITQNWMMYAVNGYGCNFDYMNKGWKDIGLWNIADGYPNSCSYWDCTTMSNTLNDLSYYIWYDGEDGSLCVYSGCWDPPYAPTFRSYTSGYNAEAAFYKAKFLAGLKAYLAYNPGAKADIMADLHDANADFHNCLASASEHGACSMCDITP